MPAYRGEIRKELVKVDEIHDDFVGVHFVGDESLHSGLKWLPEYGDMPPVGTLLWCYHTGFGGEVRGYEWLNGNRIFYWTDEDMERRRQEWLRAYNQENLDNYNAHIDEWRTTIETLDSPFKSRIQRYINEHGEQSFFVDHMGDYELFVVNQANDLYRHWQTTGAPVKQWFDNFSEMSWESQKAAFPKLDEGHSNNTFGFMVMLARNVANGIAI